MSAMQNSLIQRRSREVLQVLERVDDVLNWGHWAEEGTMACVILTLSHGWHTGYKFAVGDTSGEVTLPAEMPENTGLSIH